MPDSSPNFNLGTLVRTRQPCVDKDYFGNDRITEGGTWGCIIGVFPDRESCYSVRYASGNNVFLSNADLADAARFLTVSPYAVACALSHMPTLESRLRRAAPGVGVEAWAEAAPVDSTERAPRG